MCNGQFKIDYVSLDDATAAAGKWDAAKEQENANKAVSDPDAMVYLGPFNSGAAKVSIPILNQAKPGPLAMISPANTYPGLTKGPEFGADKGEPDVYYPAGKRSYFRVVPADDIQGAVAARWARSLGARALVLAVPVHALRHLRRSPGAMLLEGGLADVLVERQVDGVHHADAGALAFAVRAPVAARCHAPEHAGHRGSA